MNSHKQIIDFLIKANMDSILAAQKSYGGVYLAKIDMTQTDNCMSLEIELDEGTIACSYSVPPSEAEVLYAYVIRQLKQVGVNVYTYYADFEHAIDVAS